jgi:hypothetical protein
MIDRDKLNAILTELRSEKFDVHGPEMVDILKSVSQTPLFYDNIQANVMDIMKHDNPIDVGMNLIAAIVFWFKVGCLYGEQDTIDKTFESISGT